MELSTREIALFIWICVAAAYCLVNSSVRPSALNLVGRLFQRQIVAVITLLYVYLGIVVWGLSLVSLWDWGQLKNTLIWSLAVGMALLFRINEVEDEPHFFRKWIRGQLKVVAVVEFVITYYTFPLLVEFLLFPTLFIIFTVIALGERHEAHRRAASFLSGILATFGLVLVAYAAYMVIIDFQNFISIKTVQDFYTPVFLSIAFVPFVFILYIYSTYQLVFGVPGVSIKNERLKRYAKFKSVLAFGLNVDRCDAGNGTLGSISQVTGMTFETP